MEVYIILLKRLLGSKLFDKRIWGGICTAVVSATAVFLFLLMYRNTVLEKQAAELGETAVKLLYDFGTAEQLDYQMIGLKEITTDAVFNQLTIDNEERTLNTYLKFKNKPVTVNVIKSTSDYVMYSLNTEYISGSRIFVFFFEIDPIENKIKSVREVEAIDFLSSYN